MGKKSRLFLVLCLHRSGSSATAGVMHHLGIHMGTNLIASSPYNRKGHFENIGFRNINDEILQTVKSSWNNPPSSKKIKASNFTISKMRTFLSENVKPVWGLKDPRTLLTFEVWKPVLEEVADITYVFIHRPFEASVRSMANRDRKGIENASQILTPYLKNLYHYRHTYGLPAENIIDIHFEDMLKNPEPFVRKFNEKIGNSPGYNLKEVEKFLDKGLKNF
ncbi:sulfotransferase [Cytobacillus firmus]|uniref:sulfotransferase n=1 Tax=Cytobacillus firmus TaxID=1399 RepID=UPI002228115A|nr:sulfotransferase family protein [Cytobacillus firmus]